MSLDTIPELIWIDQNIDNDENTNYQQQLKQNNISYKAYHSIQDALDEIKQIKFRRVILLLNINMFKDFIQLFEIERNNICCSLNILVFTYNKKFVKDICSNNKEILSGYLFNQNNIFTEIEEIISYIKKGKRMSLEHFEVIKDTIYYQEGGFEKIENYEQLILPLFFHKLVEPITIEEIHSFNYYLSTFKGDIKNTIKQLDNNADMPNVIISKYWANIYTSDNNDNILFFLTLNIGLKKKRFTLFLPFIKMMYEAVKNKYFRPVVNESLYSGGTISYKELYELENNLNDNINNKDLPKVIYYFKSFKSFSKNEQKAKEFIENTQKTTGLLFVLEKYKETIEGEYISNAYIKDYSLYDHEEEVLFFPFSSFEIEKIEKRENVNYVTIYLKYLGKYRPYIEERKTQKNIFNDIPTSQFGRDIAESGLVKYKFCKFWEIKKEIKLYSSQKLNATCLLCFEKNKLLFSFNTSLKLHDIQNDKTIFIIFIHNQKINDLLKINENTFISSSDDKTIKIVELTDNFSNYLVKQSIEFHLAEVYQTIKLKGNNIFASCSNDKTIKIWNYDFNNKATLNISIDHNSEVLSILELPDSNLVSISKDGDLKIWKFNVCLKTLKGFKNPLHNCIFLLNKEIIIIGTKKKIFLININQKEIIYIFNLEYDAFSICHFNGNIFLGLRHNQCLLFEYQFEKKPDKYDFECIGKGIDNCYEISFIYGLDEKTIITLNKSNFIKIWKETEKKPDKFKIDYFSINDSEKEEESKEIRENETLKKEDNLIGKESRMEKEIIDEKNKNKFLYEKIQQLQNELNIQKIDSYKIKNLEELLKQKDEEIRRLQSINNNLESIRYRKNEKLFEEQKVFSINFISIDGIFSYYSLVCKETDKFDSLEKKIYENFPEYKDKEVFFICNGKKIDRFKSLKDNHIKENDNITIKILD